MLGDSIIEMPLPHRIHFFTSTHPLSLMPRPATKAGVSRRVKFSQLGHQGQPQTMILNQTALACRLEAAAKVQLDFLQGTLRPVLLNTDVALNHTYDVFRAWGRRQATT